MESTHRVEGEALEAVVIRSYCVYGPTGHQEAARIARACEAVIASNPQFEQVTNVILPEVSGVPYLRGVIEDIDQIPTYVRQFLPRVEGDPHLHLLSFVDPLRLATDELGIAITPRVVRLLRRTLAPYVGFDSSRSLDSRNHGLGGISRMQWRPKKG